MVLSVVLLGILAASQFLSAISGEFLLPLKRNRYYDLYVCKIYTQN